MRIPKAITFEGYRVFSKPTTILLNEKVTTLVGKNNSGKSSILNILKMLAYSTNVPDYEKFGLRKDLIELTSDPIEDYSKLKIELKFSIDEPKINLESLYRHIESSPVRSDNLRDSYFRLFENENVELRYEFVYKSYPSRHLSINKIFIDDKILHRFENENKNEAFPWSPERGTSWAGGIRRASTIIRLSGEGNPYSEVAEVLAKFIASIKIISADRIIQSKITSQVIEDVSDNLVEATRYLHLWSSTKKSKFNAVINFLKNVDDSIGDIRFEPSLSTPGEMLVKFASDVSDDSGNILLENSGSGVKELLGLATSIINDDCPAFICIDEPQAFLHPYAEELFVDLMNVTKHKFIIATHSSTFINSFSDGIVLLKKNNGSSWVSSPKKTTIEYIKEIASEIGTSAHQLLVGKGILFLEGATEVAILTQMTVSDSKIKNQLKGIHYKAIPSTGILLGRGKIAARELLNDLEKNFGLKTVVVLDKDRRTQDDLEGRIVFAEYEKIEDLLMNAEAIFDVLSNFSLEFDAKNEVNKDSFIEFYLADSSESLTKLNNIFQKFLKQDYDKVRHGKAIAAKCLTSNYESLQPFLNSLKLALSRF